MQSFSLYVIKCHDLGKDGFVGARMPVVAVRGAPVTHFM